MLLCLLRMVFVCLYCPRVFVCFLCGMGCRDGMFILWFFRVLSVLDRWFGLTCVFSMCSSVFVCAHSSSVCVCVLFVCVSVCLCVLLRVECVCSFVLMCVHLRNSLCWCVRVCVPLHLIVFSLGFCVLCACLCSCVVVVCFKLCTAYL